MQHEKHLIRQNLRPFFGTAPNDWNENPVFFFKITQNKVKSPFFLDKCPFYYVMFGGCPYILNMTQDKAYNNQLRRFNPTNRKKILITLANVINISIHSI